MQIHLNRKRLQEIDQLATDKYGIPSIILMENAGRAVAEESIKLIRKKIARITVICGKGNNGGDGLVCARHLHNHGYKVRILYLGKLSDTQSRTNQTNTNLNIALRMSIPIIELPPDEPANRLALTTLKSADVIIDAIFGIGLTREIQGPLREFIAQINSLNKPVVAVDIPSGLDTDSGKPLGIAIRAKMTVTFGYPKIGFKNKKAREYTGQVVVADISLPTNGRTKGLKN